MRLTSLTRISQEEMNIVETPDVINNIHSIYANILQSGSSSWKALAFLRKMKHEEDGFDYRIHFNEEHVPDGIVWTTKQMKENLIRYGDILFLDSQKRQYNNMCWPYIGPVVKNNENEIRCVAESIVITEDMSMYKWILQTLEIMEPKWSFKNIDLIFADGLITDRLLEELHIDDTCVLRGDYYHLMNEVFPKEHNFGRLVFPTIKAFLKCMLLSKSEEEWNAAYSSAISLLQNYPRKKELLNAINNRPSYYSGYFANEIPGNLNLHGTSCAESNHAAIVRHLGDSGAWNIVFHIKKLLERNQFYIKKDLLHDDRMFMTSRCFVSNYESKLAIDDEVAKRSLSSHAYNHYWIMVIKRSQKHQFEELQNSSGYIVWPIGEKQKKENTINVYKNQRCGCSFRVSFQCPCPHEFCIETKFNIDEYSSRWLNNATYREIYLASDNAQDQSDESLVSCPETSMNENQMGNQNEEDIGNDNVSHFLTLQQHPNTIEPGSLNNV